jgi:hypothetical protein
VVSVTRQALSISRSNRGLAMPVAPGTDTRPAGGAGARQLDTGAWRRPLSITTRTVPTAMPAVLSTGYCTMGHPVLP